MNYTFQSRKQRCLHSFKPANVNRGVVYPTIKDFYMRLRNGEDLSRYLADTPFTGDSVFAYEDYLDLVQRNRFMLDQLVKLRNDKPDGDETPKPQDEASEDEDEERSDSDDSAAG